MILFMVGVLFGSHGRCARPPRIDLGPMQKTVSPTAPLAPHDPGVVSAQVPDAHKELLDAWAEGDRRAGDQLFRQVFPVLIRFFGNKVPAADTEDLVQHTLEALVEKRDRFRADSRFTTFAIGMARIELLRYLRQRHGSTQGKVVDFEARSVADLDPGPSQMAAVRDEHRLLLAALRRIPVELQIVLELHYWEELTTAEMAEVIDVPVGTIKSRLRRARE